MKLQIWAVLSSQSKYLGIRFCLQHLLVKSWLSAPEGFLKSNFRQWECWRFLLYLQQGEFLVQVLVTSTAKQRAKIADRASDNSTVCSNGLSYNPKKGDRKAEEKKPWKLGVKTEKQLQPVADNCMKPVMLEYFLQPCHVDSWAA